MKYVVSKENKSVVKEVDDAVLGDYVATGKWEETDKKTFDEGIKNFVSKKVASAKIKDEI